MGNGGRLFISADKLLLNNGGRLNASTALGLGGDVTLNQRDLELRGNSEITVEALGGVGDGGNLDINADNITVIENSQITANAIGGVGGNIRIAATGIFAPDGAITASSQLGIDGNIRVSNPDVDPSQGLVEVKANSLVTANLITRSCGDYRDSQFTVTGSGGLPPNPNDTLPDDATWEDLRLPTEAGSSFGVSPSPSLPVSQSPLIEATGWAVDDRGDIILISHLSFVPSPWSLVPCQRTND